MTSSALTFVNKDTVITPDLRNWIIQNDLRSHPTVVVYHAHCNDGLGAVYALKCAELLDESNTVYIPGVYKEALAGFAGKVVYVLDFSYPPAELLLMSQYAKAIIVIDHHKTTVDAYKTPELPFDPSVVKVVLSEDNSMSGAGLTWRLLNFTKPIVGLYEARMQDMPPIIEAIEDRDLWIKETPFVEEVNLWIRDNSNIAEMEKRWDDLSAYNRFCSEMGSYTMAVKQYKTLCKSIASRAILVKFDDYVVPGVACPPELKSDVNAEIAKLFPKALFTFTFETDPKTSKTAVSMRTQTGFKRLPEIAVSYGGGGHQSAASFVVDLQVFLESILGDWEG